MNKIVKEQLRKCKVAEIPNFDDNTTHMLIKKKSVGNGVAIKVGKCYLIELADYLIHAHDGFDFHVNWNNNLVPPCKYYKCECINIMGKFMKINGAGYDYNTNTDLSSVWSGWLPLEGVKILGEV